MLHLPTAEGFADWLLRTVRALSSLARTLLIPYPRPVGLPDYNYDHEDLLICAACGSEILPNETISVPVSVRGTKSHDRASVIALFPHSRRIVCGELCGLTQEDGFYRLHADGRRTLEIHERMDRPDVYRDLVHDDVASLRKPSTNVVRFPGANPRTGRKGHYPLTPTQHFSV